MRQLLITIAALVLVETAFADPIHEAAKYGDLAGVQAELDKGVDVDLKDEGERTPLHHAADVSDIGGWLINKGILEEKTQVAELLIAKGADVTMKDIAGDTPLHETILYSTFNQGVAELLIVNGADVNAKNDSGFTLLHLAFLSSSATIEFLIANGADVNATYGTPFLKLTVIDYYDFANIGWGMEAQETMGDNIELIRKHGGKKYYEINPAEIVIFRNPLNKQIYISVFGLDGETYDILHSSNLKKWNVIKTITIDGYDNSIKPETTPDSSFFKIRPTD